MCDSSFETMCYILQKLLYFFNSLVMHATLTTIRVFVDVAIMGVTIFSGGNKLYESVVNKNKII